MTCFTACTFFMMDGHGKKKGAQGGCSTKAILYAFVVLCLVMVGSVCVYWYHVNEIFTLSVKLTDNVKEFYEKDAKAFLQVLQMRGSDHSSVNKTASEVKPQTTNKDQSAETKSRPSAKSETAAKTVKPTAKPTTKEPAGRANECTTCFEHSFNYILDNDKICARNDKSPEIDVIVLIFTVHTNRVHREMIRRTWLTPAKNNSMESNIRYAFLLGAPDKPEQNKIVKEEFDVFRDILQEDFKDSYTNLTYKTMMAFKWASTKCKDAKFVMKTDDDMYVNLKNILTTVNTHKEKLQTNVGGACHQRAQPIRDYRSKWYASKKSFPGSHYPGFCSGTGYVTSMNVATKVFEVSKHVPFFHLEDVYVALCMKKLGYRLLGLGGFNAARFKDDPCIYQGDMIRTSHQVPPEMMSRMWFGKCKH